MDLALALELLSPRPVEVDAARATSAGAWVPVVLPLGWLDAETRGTWLVGETGVALHHRVAAALDAGLESTAWQLVASRRRAALADYELAGTLQRWAARRQADLRLPAVRGPVLVLDAAGERSRHTRVAEAALRDVQALFAHLLWPRWAGPAVVVVGAQPLGELVAERDVVARPALPLVRLGTAPAEAAWREELARAFAGLVLELERGEVPWPAWFERGMIALAAARARGEGPSPRGMQAIRADAGAEGIRRCLLGADPDPELSLALCAYAAHPRRAARLGALMEVLRNGADGLSAFEIAYGMTPQRLAVER